MKRSNDDLVQSVPSRKKRSITAVNGLILLNTAIFFADKVFRMPCIMQHLYLIHNKWKWWQFLTSCFCHGWGSHLCGNMFALHLFGSAVEDELGWHGLLLSYTFCGISGKIASLLAKPNIPHCTIGASGAVFGLFVLSIAKSPLNELFDWGTLPYIFALWILVLTGGSLLRLPESIVRNDAPVLVFQLLMLTKLSWRQWLDWRTLVEVASFRQLVSDLSVAMQGVKVNHGNSIGHVAGAAAGVVLALGMRVAAFRRYGKVQQTERKNTSR
jgi:membrane associated rhomboid family serine protease